MSFGRVDGNQQAIVKEIRTVPGFTVAVTSNLGKGFPDIAVGFDGITGLYEIKDPAKPLSRRKLTDDEKSWHSAWMGHVKVAETSTEIIVDMRRMSLVKREGETHANRENQGVRR